MPLDEFKTQVLLLHSEQSTLDSLRSGFDDSYTVHCARSGSEALTTLVDTPINVIISAQDLPGMSGLEALREAKKRSPDTIGILLAGTSDDGLETLVGDKEVFQVVRENVTGDSLLKLVDAATKELRLMALAQSANDTAADVDEPAPESIVMETSEDGETIVTDNTGRMRALRPPHISAVAPAGAQSVDLLVLTNDQDFLSTIKESSHGMHTVHYATTLAQALDSIRENNVGVSIVDAAMVGERVEQLTQHLQKASARLVSIVAGRRNDGEMLMDLINRGKVYRFLLKPVSPGRARLAVEASVKHHLEAPDSAFEVNDDTAARQRLSVPAPKSTHEADAEAGPQRESNIDRRVTSSPEFPLDPEQTAVPGSTATDPLQTSRADALTDALGGDDSSLVETMTGLFSAVGKKISGDSDADEPRASAGLSDSTSPAAARPGGSLLQKLTVPGIGVVAIILVAGALFWFLRGADDVVTGEELLIDEPVTTEADTMPGVPANDNSTVQVEMAEDDALVGEELAAIETALLEFRFDDAGAALQRVRSTNPDNARLPFLTTQLEQMQLRAHLTDARAAIRESRFEDASSALAAARSLNLSDNSEVDAAEIELDTARSEGQAGDVLALANARLVDNYWLSPPNDNARHYFELALSIDPQNAAAQQGLAVIASKLALQARSEMENGNLDLAENLIDEASALDPANIELAAAVGALSEKRDANATDLRRAETERLAAEQRAANQRAADQRAAEQRAAEQRAAAERPPPEERATELSAPAAAVAPEEEAAEQPAGDLPGAADGDATSVATDRSNQDSQTIATENPASSVAPTTISSLKRRKYVAPKYPRAAQRRNLSGWVDVVFTVSTDGSVKEISIPDSEPGETFVNAATRAVAKWEFDPVIENGAAVEKRVGVRLMFAVE